IKMMLMNFVNLMAVHIALNIVINLFKNLHNNILVLFSKTYNKTKLLKIERYNPARHKNPSWIFNDIFFKSINELIHFCGCTNRNTQVLFYWGLAEITDQNTLFTQLSI